MNRLQRRNKDEDHPNHKALLVYRDSRGPSGLLQSDDSIGARTKTATAICWYGWLDENSNRMRTEGTWCKTRAHSHGEYEATKFG
jgi:hypothetical protein